MQFFDNLVVAYFFWATLYNFHIQTATSAHINVQSSWHGRNFAQADGTRDQQTRLPLQSADIFAPFKHSLSSIFAKPRVQFV